MRVNRRLRGWGEVSSSFRVPAKTSLLSHFHTSRFWMHSHSSGHWMLCYHTFHTWTQ
jgi:hypothetical protein